MTTATAEEPVAQSAPADVTASGAAAVPAPPVAYERPDGERLIAHWSRLVARASGLPQTPQPETFVASLSELDDELLTVIKHDIDRTLAVGMYAAAATGNDYCAAHSLRVALGCQLAGRALGGWDDDALQQLRMAALTMNIGMAILHDQLALQDGPLTPEQRAEVDAHAGASAELLESLGVKGGDWLETVRKHREVAAGPIDGQPVAAQMARLIQRPDQLTAVQSLRAYQQAQTPSVAARQIYKDKDGQPDHFGAAAIKALGIYPPGTVVRLTSEELALVLRRGTKANQPLVAAVAQDGTLRRTMKPQLRDTSQAAFAIKGGRTQAELNVRLDLAALLDLTA